MILEIKFKDQSESFVLGCEYGRILTLIEKREDVVNNFGFPIHIKNKALISETCEKFGYAAIFGESYFDTYIQFHAIKKTKLN